MAGKNQNGSVLSAVLLIFLALGFLGALGFGFTQYSKAQDYQKDYKAKAAVDISAALKTQKAELDVKYAEAAKSPVKTYKGPITYGSITFDYPKTWSAYVDESNTGNPINGYFFPDVVPSLTGDKTAFALRVELINQTYSAVIKQYDSQIKAGSLKAAAYIPPKMKGVPNVQPGVRFDGALDKDTTGAAVVIQVRDKTLKIYTESKDYVKDFDTIVLPSLTFAP